MPASRIWTLMGSTRVPVSQSGAVPRRIKDPDFSAAACRAYNRWLADYCKPYPERLFGAAMLPMQTIEGAVQETIYAAKDWASLRVHSPDPYNGRVLHDLCSSMRCGLWRKISAFPSAFTAVGKWSADTGDGAFHRGARRAPLRGAYVRDDGGGYESIMCGVCDRFPRLKIAFLESGGGWMAGWLDRMDRHFDDVGMNDTGLTMRPARSSAVSVSFRSSR